MGLIFDYFFTKNGGIIFVLIWQINIFLPWKFISNENKVKATLFVKWNAKSIYILVMNWNMGFFDHCYVIDVASTSISAEISFLDEKTLIC